MRMWECELEKGIGEGDQNVKPSGQNKIKKSGCLKKLLEASEVTGKAKKRHNN